MATYAEFAETNAYSEALPGAQLGVKLTCRDDPTLQITAMGDFSVTANKEVIPVEEGGNEGVSELVMGRIDYSVQGSLYLRPKTIDRFLSTRKTFLDRQTWDAVVYAGARWPDAQDADPDLRVYYTVRGIKWASETINHGARGEARISLSGSAVEFISGEEYAEEAGD